MAKNPFERTEESSGYRSTNWGKVGGIAGLGIGAAFLGRKTIDYDPSKLRYLQAGVEQLGINWWELAGRQEGQVRLSDIAMNYLKAFEESFGGIPRTFDLFALSSRGMVAPTGKAGTRMAFDADYVRAFQPYLEKEVGRTLTSQELAYGLELREYGIGGRTEVGLFSQVAPEGADPIMARARVMQRFWAPPGADPKYHHRSRLAATRQRIQGAKAVPAGFMDRKLQQGVVSEHPFLIVGGKSRLQDWVRTAHALSTEISARYFRLLDDPVQIIDDAVRGMSNISDRLLDQAAGSKTYKNIIRNRFGVGGTPGLERAGLGELWSRHVKQVTPWILGLTAAYYGTNAITSTLFDITPAQMGAKALANLEVAGTRISEMTGLTALAQAQESAAPGSTSLLGLAAFPAAGALTGLMGAGLYGRARAGEWAWSSLRQETHRLPEALRFLTEKPMTRGSKWAILGGLVGGALALPFLPGAIGTTKSTEELRAEMSGTEEVPIRRGRFWEMGRTPYEGGDTMYYRPNYYAREMQQAKEVGVYGDYANRPIARAIKSIFDPYWLEKEHYADRPYPITGVDVSGWGPLAPGIGVLKSIFKPPKLMHTEEMDMGRGGTSVAGAPRRRGEPSIELGGTGKAAAVSPYSVQYQAGELAYRIQEAVGLPGFIFGAVKKELTGSADIFDEAPVMATAADIGSERRGYWDLQLGGAATASEAYRRWNPSKRYQIEEFNPLRNTMPSWMPGDNYYINFKEGDPYAKIKEGEARLPGPGFEARFPELEGLSMEEYPLAYRMKILGDVAPHSSEFRQANQEVQRLAAMGKLTTKEQELTASTLHQRAQIKKGRRFQRREDQGLIGKYWSALVRGGRALPSEQIIPFSPVHKFAGETDVVTAYAGERVYSTDYPSWNRPIEHFIQPAINAALRMVGFKGIPKREQERRDTQQYFDMLEYVKQRGLEKTFRDEGEARSAWTASMKAERTRFGVDPFSRREMVSQVVEKREKDYIRAMMELEDNDEQAKAMSLVSDDVRPLLQAQYTKRLYVHLAAQKSLSREQEGLMNKIEALRAAEGQVADEGDLEDYEREVRKGDWKEDNFADYVRMRRAQEYFKQHGLPSGDWIGWRKDVDLEDVKLKMVIMEGKDFHDFGGWETQVRELGRKPYVTEAVQDLLASRSDSGDQIYKMLSKSGHSGIMITNEHSSENTTNVVVSQDNRGRMDHVMYRMGLLGG